MLPIPLLRLLILALVATAALGSAPAQDAPAPISVFVSIPPQREFVERIGGDRVQVEVLVESGQNPHAYDPAPRQIARLARARLYFRIGVPFEDALLRRVGESMPRLRIVDTTAGIPLRPMEDHDDAHDGHAHDGAEGMDPHIWLSPRLVMMQALTIHDALVATDPAGAAVYRENLAGYLADLGRLHGELEVALAPVRGKTFLVYHPAFGYFADEYGLKQHAVETDGREPGAKSLAQLIDRARRENVRVVFVQKQFGSANAQVIANAIGGAVVAIDPLADDYLESMRALANAVREGLGG